MKRFQCREHMRVCVWEEGGVAGSVIVARHLTACSRMTPRAVIAWTCASMRSRCSGARRRVVSGTCSVLYKLALLCLYKADVTRAL